MESKPNTTVAAAAIPANAIVIIRDEKKLPQAMPKKKRGAMHLLRTALFIIRRGSGKKSKPAIQIEVAASGVLNKVVGSMRPLHMQGHQSPLREAAAPAPVLTLPSPGEHFVDVLPASPVSTLARPYSPSHSSTSGGSTSRYASAVNLQELAEGESDDDEDDEGSAYDANGGDDMIDAKAEEFIAQFYQQMRAQNYNEMIRRRSKRHAH